MSKERALRRAAREAQAQRSRVRRERLDRRRAARRALVRRLTPRRGHTGRLYARRRVAERIAIGLGGVLAIGFVWWQFEDLATRLALTIVVAVAAPAAVVLTFDRRT
ncbi:MAG: hypothetical protein E6F99_05600 [Actinobacteria bacterium]|nr:MAG: hypothetical protein E6F99_05600 [Actinomycetota bacterium]